MILPQFLQSYFWEIDFDKLSFEKNKSYIIKRILETGDLESAKWLHRNASSEDISAVLKKYRGFSPKTAAFWALILDIPEKEVLCLQKPYRQKLKEHFLY